MRLAHVAQQVPTGLFSTRNVVTKPLTGRQDVLEGCVLKEIGSENRSQARRLFECLAMAIRPLHAEELAELLMLDFDGGQVGNPKLNKGRRWDIPDQAFLSTCSSSSSDHHFSNNPPRKIHSFLAEAVDDLTTLRHEDDSSLRPSLPSTHILGKSAPVRQRR